MFEFFFYSRDAYNLAMEVLRKTDIMCWAFDTPKLRICLWNGDIKERLVSELTLRGFDYDSYRTKHYETEKGGELN